MVGPGSLRVLWDVHVVQPRLTIGDLSEAVGQRRPAGPQRFHLGACEHEPRLVHVLDVVLVPGAPVPCDDLASLLACHRTPQRSAATLLPAAPFPAQFRARRERTALTGCIKRADSAGGSGTMWRRTGGFRRKARGSRPERDRRGSG